VEAKNKIGLEIEDRLLRKDKGTGLGEGEGEGMAKGE
jgi:hypothetical protein